MKITKAIFKAIFVCLIALINLNLQAQEKKVKYHIDGKEVTYYTLSHIDSLRVPVNGPGKLTVTTRAHFTSNSPDSLSYSLIYQIDKEKIAVYKAKKVIREDTSVSIESSGDRPSTLKTFTIKIDPDVHSVSFLMLKDSPQVDLHYKYIRDEVPDWKDVKPVNDTVTIGLMVDKGKDKSYYRLSAASSKKFKVKGPTYLRVITRLEYDYTMQGMVSYRIQVKRNDTMPETFKLSAKPSSQVKYIDDGKHIPGSLEKFYLDVPPGEHTFEFSMVNKHFTALIRVSKQKPTKK